MRKYKIKKKNRLRDSKSSLYGDFDEKTKTIRINMKKREHKKDKAELASTIKHEMLHAQHPKMTEKEIYKRSAKTKLTQKEKRRLLAKLL